MHFKDLLTLFFLALLTGQLATAQTSDELARLLGITFPNGSGATVLLTRDGKQYSIDATRKTVTRMSPAAEQGATDQQVQASAADASVLFRQNCAGCHGADGKGKKDVGTPNFTDPAFKRSATQSDIQAAIRNGKDGRMPAWSGKLNESQISGLTAYVQSLGTNDQQDGPGRSESQPSAATQNLAATKPTNQNDKQYQIGDDVLVSLPTGRPTDRHGLYLNFAHRFAYDPAFTGTNRAGILFGLDGVAVSSFGLRYGVTERLSVGVYRSPSLVNRPIQLMAGYNILEESKGNPLNLMFRVSIEGQNNFMKNYTENLEAIVSRSVTKRAQVYLVPTMSFNTRPLVSPAGFDSKQILNFPGVNSFALGVGLAIDVRPTVALLAEVIPTLANGDELGIHRPAFSFGIQKKIWRHAFTLGLTNSPGTTVSQRSATRAEFLGDPSADTFGGLVLGFNITRQIR